MLKNATHDVFLHDVSSVLENTTHDLSSVLENTTRDVCLVLKNTTPVSYTHLTLPTS